MQVTSRVRLGMAFMVVSFQLREPEHDLLDDGGVQLIIDEFFFARFEHEIGLFQHAEVIETVAPVISKMPGDFARAHAPAPEQQQDFPPRWSESALKVSGKAHRRRPFRISI